LPSKNIYDSGDYPKALDHIESLIERERDGGVLDPQVLDELAEKGVYRGTQPSVLIEPGVSGSDWTDRQRTAQDELQGRDRDEVSELPEHLRGKVKEDGSISVYLATDSSGQGHQTLVSQLMADQLEVLPSKIEVEYLGSVESPTEYGSAASRMAVMLSGAAEGLGDKMRENARTLAAEILGCQLEDVRYHEGQVTPKNGDITLSELARHETDITVEEGFTLSDLASYDLARDGDRLLSASYNYEHPATGVADFDEAFLKKYPVYPTAAFAANAPIVEVDTRSGEIEILKFLTVRDCGTMLNPVIVEGQAHGGIAQGVGAALLEEFGYDDDGQPQSVTFFDYILPSISNVPPIEMEHTETPSPYTATGAKGTGEGGMIDAPASIASAINDALDPLDVTADELPFTPNRVREAIREIGDQ
ncbi:MAG: xanthine dehydrogenase family protein molybdopterin-binding subunit, partial [Halobacteriaceae archaeon]